MVYAIDRYPQPSTHSISPYMYISTNYQPHFSSVAVNGAEQIYTLLLFGPHCSAYSVYHVGWFNQWRSRTGHVIVCEPYVLYTDKSLLYTAVCVCTDDVHTFLPSPPPPSQMTHTVILLALKSICKHII